MGSVALLELELEQRGPSTAPLRLRRCRSGEKQETLLQQQQETKRERRGNRKAKISVLVRRRALVIPGMSSGRGRVEEKGDALNGETVLVPAAGNNSLPPLDRVFSTKRRKTTQDAGNAARFS
ncbi:uncharacterized protein LOC144754957 [Lissotriton helveticus]